MKQHQVTRPTVSVEQVVNADGDITHCLVKVGDQVLEAPFNIGHSRLEEIIENATGVVLNVGEHMAVTNASRKQMEREGERVKQVLLTMPAGTIGVVDGGLFFWLDSKQELVWAEHITIGGNPGDINPGYIGEFGEIDTDELFQVAEDIRKWLREPKTQVAELDWLRAVEA